MSQTISEYLAAQFPGEQKSSVIASLLSKHCQEHFGAQQITTAAATLPVSYIASKAMRVVAVKAKQNVMGTGGGPTTVELRVIRKDAAVGAAADVLTGPISLAHDLADGLNQDDSSLIDEDEADLAEGDVLIWVVTAAATGGAVNLHVDCVLEPLV